MREQLYPRVEGAGFACNDEELNAIFRAGVRTVQLRIKKPADADAAWHGMLEREVRQSVEDSRAAGAELFVNDHWQVAHAFGATGAHLGQEDLVALGDDGRAALQATGMALGISSHSLWELARARTLSPRYIACGPVWPTLTKDMPWLPQGLDNLAWIENVVWFAAKVYFFLFLFFWLRATLPRLRYDQLMRFGWKVMLPIALGNIVVTSIAVFIYQQMK